MSMTDPIADMLTRIRNAQQARHDSVAIPASRIKADIARILKDEGFIRDFELPKEAEREIKIQLRYSGKREPVVTGLKRVSKPGLRVYVKSKDMPRILGGLGIAIVSTPRGVMTANEARRTNVGGEILCYVW
ncbi:MAG TPA: 30S ribosomal protein S8 [Chloroflexota bacterium]|jgi:small subunit ribosomal protein S8|nr:30S ribosomal protein S8 [Chloroflexota bacterium]